MNLPDERELKQYDRWGVNRPTHEEHGEFDLDKLVPFKAHRWWCEGDLLYAEGNHGVVVNRIPVDYICLGTDENNLPILRKVDIKESSAADRGAK